MLLVQKLQRIVQIEKKRYSTKGLLNCILAVVLLLGGQYTLVTIGKQYWPEHIQNKLMFVWVGSVGCHFFTTLISFILHLPGYLGWSQYFDRHLINKKSTKPWERKNWNQMRSKVIKNLVLNQVIISPFLIYVANRSGIRVRLEGDFPTFLELFSQFIIVYFIEDCFFYWGHRLFHTPYFYKMHKVHHEYDSLFTWAALYFHPLDFLLANMLPSVIAFSVLGKEAHCFTFFYWVCWKAYISTESHSGYEFHWSPLRILPFVGGAAYHDHHHSHNVGNFAGSCYLWDLFLDTNVPYMDEYLKN